MDYNGLKLGHVKPIIRMHLLRGTIGLSNSLTPGSNPGVIFWLQINTQQSRYDANVRMDVRIPAASKMGLPDLLQLFPSPQLWFSLMTRPN